MPLGWERLNSRSSTPNPNVVFIKPLPGANEPTALDFLNRLAAICVPICKANYLYVASLEEFPPNREFWGRNFNAGEVIQLVLRSPSNGQWLPFRFVQMVLMHELAHCKEMNHSGAFWKVRNQYAAELKVLWNKNYTGEGLWGRGQSLYDGQYTGDTLPSDEVLPASLCGGTYRSRRKRKRKGQARSEKPKVTYAERKQRRIEKKFGKAGKGQALGGDDAARVTLEGGKTIKGKPRVANSERGRNLRAAAAEARLKATQQATDGTKSPEDEESETESEFEWADSDDEKEAVDTDGTKLTDSDGRGLVKVCEDEDAANDPNALNELEELGHITLGPPTGTSKQMKLTGKSGSAARQDSEQSAVSSSKTTATDSAAKPRPKTNGTSKVKKETSDVQDGNQRKQRPLSSFVDLTSSPTAKGDIKEEDKDPTAPLGSDSKAIACLVCSCENEAFTLTCIACANVLNTSRVRNHWQCQSLICRGGLYVNSGDAGVCGVCGARKELASLKSR